MSTAGFNPVFDPTDKEEPFKERDSKSTEYATHYRVWHNPSGKCNETPRCPNEGWIMTVSGPAMADDPNRDWTESEIDQGLPWKRESTTQPRWHHPMVLHRQVADSRCGGQVGILRQDSPARRLFGTDYWCVYCGAKFNKGSRTV